MLARHVVIVVENLPVPRDHRVWLFATTLRKAGYRVTVVSPSDKDAPAGVYRQEGVVLIRHALFQAKSWIGYFLEYPEALLKERAILKNVYAKKPFQVMHVCDPPDLLYLLAKPYKKRGVRLVFDHHDLSPELILAKKSVRDPAELSFFFRLVYKALLLCERHSVTEADAVIATNETYRAIELSRDGLPEEKSFVVRSGLREKELKPGKERREDGVFRLAYLGVMARQDGVDILLRALALLKERARRSFALELMGDGPEFGNLKKLASELGLEKETNFRGFTPKKEAMEILAESDLGVTPDPSTPMNDASTMLKTLDYMAAGLPQILFDLKEHRTTCRDAAFYVDKEGPEALCEGIFKLMNDPAKREELSAKASARIRELAWERDGEPKLLALYDRL